jgi:hypothetical protein
MSDAITEALEDLAKARSACLAALEDRHIVSVDKVKTAAELRLIAKQRLELLALKAEAEGERQRNVEVGIWQA